MKKILISLLMMFALFTGYTQVRNVDANKINVRNLLYSNGFYLIYNGDSLGQFDYDNMEDPTLPLDGVNLRTLRRSILAALDTSYVIDGDTIIIPRPDSLYDEADSTWKFSGMHIKFINQKDTFWNTYDNKWVHNGEQINHYPPDTIFDSQSQVWLGIDDTANIDPSIYNELDSLFIESEGVWKSNRDTLSFADILERDSLLMIYYIAIQINSDTLASITDDFYMFRKDPNCTHCWQYKLKSEPSTAWELFFCIPVPYSEIGIQREFQNILKIDYAGYWDIVSQGARDSIYFVKDSVDLSEKVLIQRNDSIIWGTYKAGSIDSLFDVDRQKWLKNTDTIYTKRDSIFYNGEWVKNDTVHIVDNSATNEFDSIFYNGEWIRNDTVHIVDNSATNELDSIYDIVSEKWLKNNDSIRIDTSFWASDVNGLHSKLDNIGIGRDSEEGYALTILRDTDDGTGIAMKVISNDGAAALFNSLYDVGISVNTQNDNSYCAFFGGTGIGIGTLSNKISVGTVDRIEYAFPTLDGDSLDVISTDGAGKLEFRTLGTMSNFNFWYGTQAEWTANTPHDGIYPQSETTYWNIKD